MADQEKELELARMLGQLPIPAYIFSFEQRRFLAVNALFCTLTGHPEHDLLNGSWQTVMMPGDGLGAESAAGVPSKLVSRTFKRRDDSLAHCMTRIREMKVVTHNGDVRTAQLVVILSTSNEAEASTTVTPQ
jgi:hypothetical protein